MLEREELSPLKYTICQHWGLMPVGFSHCRTGCLDGIMLKGNNREEVPVVVHRHIQMNHR